MDFRNIYKHPLLDDKNYNTIREAHKVIQFDRGEYLLKHGDIANEYYCLENGLIRSYAINPQGNQITTDFFGKGDIVIEVSSVFLRIPTKENIQSLEQSVCWKLTLSDFQCLYNTIEGFREWGRMWMSAALFDSKQRALSIITDSAKERYLALLKTRPDILLYAPLKYVATYLGITDSTLSKIRREVSKG